MIWNKFADKFPENYSVIVVSDGGKLLDICTFIYTRKYGRFHGLNGHLAAEDILFWAYAQDLNIPSR